MTQHDDLSAVMVSPVERRFHLHLTTALAWEASRQFAGGVDQGHLTQAKYAVRDFFELMARESDSGYALGAAVFLEMADRFDRAVRARFLTRLAYMMHAVDERRQKAPLREQEFGHLGRFLQHIVVARPDLLVEWAEDMNQDDPTRGLTRQPAAVIRGTLMSPFIRPVTTVKFWELAARSDRFPRRILWEPCLPEEGVILSQWHARFFGEVFAVLGDEARDQFTSIIAEQTITKMLRVEDPLTGFWTDRIVPATANERRTLLMSIAGHAGRLRQTIESRFGLT